MPKYFHVTSVENLESIMREGLTPKPNDRLVGQAEYRPHIMAAIKRSDFLDNAVMAPRTYLWGPTQNPSQGMGQVVLEIELDSTFPINRDYEQLTIGYIPQFKASWADFHLENTTMKKLGSKRSLKGVSITADFRLMYKAVDGAAQQVWDEAYGAYQTNKHIPTGAITFPSPQTIRRATLQMEEHRREVQRGLRLMREETEARTFPGWRVDWEYKTVGNLGGVERFSAMAAGYELSDSIVRIRELCPQGKITPEQSDLRSSNVAYDILDFIISEAMSRGATGIVTLLNTDPQRELFQSRGFKTRVWTEQDDHSHLLDLRQASK